jgi:hypothetical protein
MDFIMKAKFVVDLRNFFRNLIQWQERKKTTRAFRRLEGKALTSVHNEEIFPQTPRERTKCRVCRNLDDQIYCNHPPGPTSSPRVKINDIKKAGTEGCLSCALLYDGVLQFCHSILNINISAVKEYISGSIEGTRELWSISWKETDQVSGKEQNSELEMFVLEGRKPY